MVLGLYWWFSSSRVKFFPFSVLIRTVWLSNRYLPKVFKKFQDAEGFLFLQDDMVLNYWNLLQADKTRLWITNKVMISSNLFPFVCYVLEGWHINWICLCYLQVPESWVLVSTRGNVSEWHLNQGNLVKKIVDNFPVHFQTSYKESTTDGRLVICSSEIFYVPQRLVTDFVDLVGIVGDLQIHHKIAVPMFFLAMDALENLDSSALATVVYRTNLMANDSITSYYTAQVPAVYPLKVQTENDFVKLVRLLASGDPLLLELVWSMDKPSEGGWRMAKENSAASVCCSSLFLFFFPFFFCVVILIYGQLTAPFSNSISESTVKNLVDSKRDIYIWWNCSLHMNSDNNLDHVTYLAPSTITAHLTQLCFCGQPHLGGKTLWSTWSGYF